MEFKYTCPDCHQTFLANDSHVGLEIACPNCSFKSVVRNEHGSYPMPPPLEESLDLTLEDLTTSKEKTYFGILLIISILGWLIIAISMIGIFYAFLAGVAAWFASGLLAAHLKSESIKVTPEQLPVLHGSLEEVCRKLKLSKIPEFYIVQHNGVLNAFATRHSGRNFIVIFSDLLEALGHDSPQVRFLIGHEIGHIRRNHLLKRLLLIPSMIIPLIGKAYHRACEATCDRFGLFAAGNTQGATLGLTVLAGGKEAAPMVNATAFARQHHEERGFFVSWHELASGYPTLSQRVSKILAVKHTEFARKAGRNPLAYLFAPIFTFQTLILVYILAVFGAIALPAVNKALQKGKEAQQRNRVHSQLQKNQGALR